MAQSRIAVIGAAGWRAQFYLRVAEALPATFQIAGLVVRDPEKGEAQAARWSAPAYRDVESLLEVETPDFAIVSVTGSAAADVITDLAERDVPVLCETPPADNEMALQRLHDLTQRGAKIQVAEQYARQPMHAARLAVARSGKLGRVTQAQVSAAHGYHVISLLRHFLDVGFEDVTITGQRFDSPIVQGPGRGGPPSEHSIKQAKQSLAWLRFGDDKLGVHDFTGEQYFSWIRSPRILIRGERGEINNTTVRYLADYSTPIESELRRVDAGHDGNLEGYYHKGVLCAGEWVYRNPFIPARLSDEEIAIADCMQKMADHVRGGPAFYPVAQAAQDKYLAGLLDEATEQGGTVHSSPQGWVAQAGATLHP